MRFLITMNMPSKSGNPVHQIVAEYPVSSLEELNDDLATNDFIEIEEFYKNNNDEYYSTGKVLLNHRYIGKVKAFVRNTHALNNE